MLKQRRFCPSGRDVFQRISPWYPVSSQRCLQISRTDVSTPDNVDNLALPVEFGGFDHPLGDIGRVHEIPGGLAAARNFDRRGVVQFDLDEFSDERGNDVGVVEIEVVPFPVNITRDADNRHKAVLLLIGRRLDRQEPFCQRIRGAFFLGEPAPEVCFF